MDKQSEYYTGLILVSGEDRPGITEALFSTLSPFSLTIMDIEQVVIRSRLILTILISLDRAHATAVEDDLTEKAESLDLDIAIAFSEQKSESIAAKTGLTHVVILSQELKPSALAALASAIAEVNGNIERIQRTASYPVTAIECVVSGASTTVLKNALTPLSAEHAVDIAVSPGGLMRWAKKLVLMDVDSTLIAQEVIELLGAKAGVQTQVKEITDRAMAGEIDFMIDTLPSAVPFIKQNRIKALAISSLERFEATPEIATFAESGYPQFKPNAWWGIAAPANTPKAIVQKLNAAISEALKTPDLIDRYRASYAIPVGGPSDELLKQISTDLKSLTETAKKGKISINN